MAPEENLDKVIEAHVRAVHLRYHRNTTQTARALGVGRSTLYRWLKKYGVR